MIRPFDESFTPPLHLDVHGNVLYSPPEVAALLQEAALLAAQRDEARQWARYWKAKFWDDHPPRPLEAEPDWLEKPK